MELPWYMRRNLKKRVWLRDKYMCRYCGDQLAEGTATVDHVIPKSQMPVGKKWTESNLVTACFDCNHSKGDRIPVGSCIIMPASKAKKYETTR